MQNYLYLKSASQENDLSKILSTIRELQRGEKKTCRNRYQCGNDPGSLLCEVRQ